MTKNFPPDVRNEHEIFADLAILCGAPGYIHALAFISFRDNYVSLDSGLTSEAMADSYVPARTVRTEFSTLLGLLLKQPIEFSTPPPHEMQRLLDRTTELLSELHECLGRPMLESMVRSIKDGTGENPFARADVLREPIFYGGESAYSFQYRSMAVARYEKDDNWLVAHKGFRIADASAVAQSITNLTTLKIRKSLQSFPQSPNSISLLPGFTFTNDDISIDTNLAPSVVAAVLSELSVETPTNERFTSLGEFNVATACPIIRGPDGTYIALQGYATVESIYESPFYWMSADKSYAATAASHRGSFTETFTAGRLAAVFGAQNVFTNVLIERNGAHVSEIDVLVLFGDRAIVGQCKSKRLTLEARKGNDLQLRDDFKKSVENAYDQALICANALGKPDFILKQADGSRIDVPTLSSIYIICAVSDHYPALTFQAREFLKTEVKPPIHAPLIADVFLIDVLAEMLESPLLFLSYLDRRVGYDDRLLSINELGILGYHLGSNLWVDKGTDLLTIADESSFALDAAMAVRREGIAGERTPKGLLTRLANTIVGRMLRMIEHQSDPALIDLGFMFLTLSGDTLDTVNGLLAEITLSTKMDGRPHDFTIALNDGHTGFTVHCSTRPNIEALASLEGHCSGRKYLQKASKWFGLVVRAADAMPKFGITLDFPWHYDAALEEATREAAKHSKPFIAPQRKKIGRNDPCFCGSGRKYKKCCIH